MSAGPAYQYAATVHRVIDGDTLCLDVDLGFGIWLARTFRLAGCNAREHVEAGGTEATLHLAELLPAGTAVTLHSVKPDKYARYDAVVTLVDGSDLVDLLIQLQWAAPWDGRGTKPVPPWPRTVA